MIASWSLKIPLFLSSLPAPTFLTISLFSLDQHCLLQGLPVKTDDPLLTTEQSFRFTLCNTSVRSGLICQSLWNNYLDKKLSYRLLHLLTQWFNSLCRQITAGDSKCGSTSGIKLAKTLSRYTLSLSWLTPYQVPVLGAAFQSCLWNTHIHCVTSVPSCPLWSVYQHHHAKINLTIRVFVCGLFVCQ